MIYMEDTLKQITEAWEGILLEMDNKLEAYASKLPDATDARTATVAMAADFLDLLTFGTPSPDLESFLLQVQFTKHFFFHFYWLGWIEKFHSFLLVLSFILNFKLLATKSIKN